ncbi:hypothetical protein JRO89_XS02G0094100 [Xanthoceras sorbifolium]|uniref:Uncharacterized protein n=1 Tax=Xanthoceras sorbifolium TaxID=99658 RepID=A0ABQ8IFC5_9ROSI|nr:hypothetical protein JRO89_XS02G0094100 [Xanthoceras sorbifolium]
MGEGGNGVSDLGNPYLPLPSSPFRIQRDIAPSPLPHKMGTPVRPNGVEPCGERASARFDQGTSQFVSSNPITTEVSGSTSRPSLNGNARLPGAVLLARARLLERLRGVSLSANGRSGHISSGGYQGESIFGDELRLVDAGDWGAETYTGSSTGGSPSLSRPLK